MKTVNHRYFSLHLVGILIVIQKFGYKSLYAYNTKYLFYFKLKAQSFERKHQLFRIQTQSYITSARPAWIYKQRIDITIIEFKTYSSLDLVFIGYLWSIHMPQSFCSTLQSNPTDEENSQHNIWEQGCEIHHLQQCDSG